MLWDYLCQNFIKIIFNWKIFRQMIKINNDLSIKVEEIKFRMIKSTGSGGQNINKNSTAIKLEFDIKDSKSMSKNIKYILLNNPNKYLTKTGKIIINANKHKSQNRNKYEAIDRFTRYLNDALKTKKKRINTKPTKSSINKRLHEKRKNSMKKEMRKKNNYEKY